MKNEFIIAIFDNIYTGRTHELIFETKEKLDEYIIRSGIYSLLHYIYSSDPMEVL